MNALSNKWTLLAFSIMIENHGSLKKGRVTLLIRI